MNLWKRHGFLSCFDRRILTSKNKLCGAKKCVNGIYVGLPVVTLIT